MPNHVHPILTHKTLDGLGRRWARPIGPESAPPAAEDDPAAALRAFLEDRPARARRRAQEGASRNRPRMFGEAFTVRRFDAAYAAVYGRLHGRPNKSTSK
jgi:hypothetical protein